MTRDRSIDLFDEPQTSVRHETTHVHAYLHFVAGEGFVVFVTRYSEDTSGPLTGIRRYPLAATKGIGVEAASRYNARRLAALAADPDVLRLARNLAQES